MKLLNIFPYINVHTKNTNLVNYFIRTVDELKVQLILCNYDLTQKNIKRWIQNYIHCEFIFIFINTINFVVTEFNTEFFLRFS